MQNTFVGIPRQTPPCFMRRRGPESGAYKVQEVVISCTYNEKSRKLLSPVAQKYVFTRHDLDNSRDNSENNMQQYDSTKKQQLYKKKVHTLA